MAILNNITLASLSQYGLPAARLLVQRFQYTASSPLPDTLAQHPQLIHIMNHGPMLAPYVTGVYLAQQLTQAGGGARKPLAAVHRRLYQLPGVKQLLEGGFGAMRPLTFQDIVTSLREGPSTDFLVLPEGDNELFGDMRSIRPFKSHRYIELAVELNIPILITAHRGTEDWALSIRLGEPAAGLLSNFSPRLAQLLADEPVLNLQGVPLPLQQLRMKSEVYQPTLHAQELSANPRQRRLQILAESRQARAVMQRLLDEMDAAHA